MAWTGGMISLLEEGDIVAVLQHRDGSYWIPRPSEVNARLKATNLSPLAGEVMAKRDAYYRYVRVPSGIPVGVPFARGAVAAVWEGPEPPEGFVPYQEGEAAPESEVAPEEAPPQIPTMLALIEVDPTTSVVRAIPLPEDEKFIEFLREGGEPVVRIPVATLRRIVDTQLENVQLQQELMALAYPPDEDDD